MNNGGLNNAAFYDDSSDEELDLVDGENHFGLAANRPAAPVRLLAHRRQLPAVPAPMPMQVSPISIGKQQRVLSCYNFPDLSRIYKLE